MAKKKYPARVRFFVADDIRVDGPNPKPIVLGLFPDDVVFVGLEKDQVEPSPEKPLVLESLAILAAFIDCKGPFETEASLYQPDGSPLFEKKKIEGGVNTDSAVGKNSINFIMKFMPFTVSRFGICLLYTSRCV